MTALLEVRDLEIRFQTPEATVYAVNGVSFSLSKGETLGLVGESGSGKSVTALSVLRLLPAPAAQIIRGRILFHNQDLLLAGASELRRIRGRQIAMIFQDPLAALNPVLTIGDQLAETLRRHHPLSRRAAADAAMELMAEVRIPDPQRRRHSYPHQLSGGLRQRSMIALALSGPPQLLIADEPATALDVTIQAEILTLLRELRTSLGLSMLLITHDFGIVAEQADRVAVMYGGQILEMQRAEAIFSRPLHPYTRALLQSIPRIGGREDSLERLPAIPGTPPEIHEPLAGCPFFPRCPEAMNSCAAGCIPETAAADGFVRCRLYEDRA